jgi:hypothetical protein
MDSHWHDTEAGPYEARGTRADCPVCSPTAPTPVTPIKRSHHKKPLPEAA